MLAVRVVAGTLAAVLVLPTLAVTAARTLPGDTLLWVILRSFAPWAVLPYAVAVVVLVATCLGPRGAGRPVALCAAVLVGSLLLVHVWWFARPFVADGSGPATGETFVVMTANLHIGGADPQALLGIIDRDDVDVLVLEEITPAALVALDEAGLARRLPHRVGAPHADRDGIMVFATSSMGAVSAIDTSSPGFGVDLTTGQGPLRVLAVHPIAPNNGMARWSADLRTVVEAAEPSRGATIVAGDFNATLDHPRILDLMATGYRDATADAGLAWRPTWPAPGNLRVRGLRLPSLFALDHVFVRGPLEATDVDAHVVPGTDHRVLVARLAWTGSRR